MLKKIKIRRFSLELFSLAYCSINEIARKHNNNIC